MHTSDPVIRAIDVGYGNTKFTTSVNNGSAVASHFSSLVHRPNGAVGTFSDSPDIYRVEVNNEIYEVGPGLDVVFEGGVRTLHDNFIDTNGYMALVYGALSRMDIDDHIDLLVVGLPVSLLKSKRADLERKLTRLHHVMGRGITIHKVMVVAQPLGGFMNFASSSDDVEGLAVARNLLIDPGFFTVDFMASTGLREIKGTSGSHPSGVSAYLKGIATQLGYDNISHIDEGLRTGRFKLDGKEVDLKAFHEKALLEIAPAAEVISNKIGSGRGIDQVILVGGGAPLFKELIQNILPGHNIICPEQSVLSNVLGFQQIGDSVWLRNLSEVA